MLHMDVKRLARFDRPGHWATGQRGEEHNTRDAGWVCLHVVIDDHSRYLYVEQHDREDADTNASTLTRALRAARPQRPEAVMTDNAMVYTRSRRFRELIDRIGARHITPPPDTPRWNGKAGRVIRTLQDDGPTPTAGRTPSSAHEP